MALQFPCAPLQLARPHAVQTGIEAVRIPLPFALDHVNCWRLFGGEILIDTGVGTSHTRKVWAEVQTTLQPSTLLLTHHHPDHAGLGSVLETEGSRVLMHPEEQAYGQSILAVEDRDADAAFERWCHRHGVDQLHPAELAAFAHGYGVFLADHALPERIEPVHGGEVLTLAGERFDTRVGRGHSPAMLMLHSAERNLLIAADQVLPSISPNISLLLDDTLGCDNDPLADYLESLDELCDLPEDILVLPSHGEPFIGLHERIAQLQRHHQERCEQLLDACGTAARAGELMRALFRDGLDTQQQVFALGETLAHLRYLQRQGLMALEDEGDTVHYRRAG